MCTVDFPTVTWSATVYQASPLFFKITYYGRKSYFIGNDDYKVDRFLDHCSMMFQACLLVVSLAISAHRAYLSSSLILKTGHLPIFGFFLFSPGIFIDSLHPLGSLPWIFSGSPHFHFYFLDSHSSVFAEARVICLGGFWWDPDVKVKAN